MAEFQAGDEVPHAFPVKTKKIAVEVGAHVTDVLCSTFDDRLFVIISQYQKLGTLVNISHDIVLEESGTTSRLVTTKVLLGKDEPLTHVIAKNLVSKVDVTKPLLLAMALKDTSPSTVTTLSDILKDLVSS